MAKSDIMIGWTTVTAEAEARKLARGLVENRLVACAQISAEMVSVYRWEDTVEEEREFRLTLKFIASRESEVRRFLEAHHPYETPQWICCAAAAGSEKYLNWVVGNST